MVDKIEDQRKPEDFIGYHNRKTHWISVLLPHAPDSGKSRFTCFYKMWIRLYAPPRVPPRVKIEEYADVVELVDSLDLGSNARACRFESCHPHQQERLQASLFSLVRMTKDSNPSKCSTPVGSDGSAACGGRSDLSEWQRSIKSSILRNAMILSGTATGISLSPAGR